MKKRISEFISQLLIVSSLFLISAPVAGQTPTPVKVQKETPKEVPVYQGTAVGLEIAGLASHLLGSDILSSEIQIQSNFKNRFLPVVEIGYGKADALNDGTNLHYKTSAPYFRIGMDYNVMYKKTHLPGYLYVGLRYGMTSFTYDIDGPTMTDPNYGGLIGIPYSFHGQKSNASWLEGLVGIKVKIYKGFCMGWSVRYKMRMSVKNHENSEPWYIPGFGKNSGSSFNLMYHLIYNLPF